MLQGRFLQSIELADQAIEVATAAGDITAESRARNARGIALAALGQVDEGTTELRHAVKLALDHVLFGELHSAYANLGDALFLNGRTREALEVAREGVRVADELTGRSRWLAMTVAEYLWALGEWREADTYLPANDRRDVGTSLIYLLLERATMALGRGDHQAARSYLERAQGFMVDSSEPQFLGACGTLTGMLELREGDIEAARDAVDEGLDRIEFCTEDATRIVRLSAVGVAIEADAAQRARDLGEDPGLALGRAEIMLARVQAAAEGDRPVESAWLAHARAEYSRAEGQSDPNLWTKAAAHWDALEWPYEGALARWRLAEAYAGDGDRLAAAAAAGDALETARRLGAGWLRGEVEGLAARARLPLDSVAEMAAEEPVAEAEDDPFGLTPRERQVLALVAGGRTNREIGETLYMAEKTASVHVSRILSKLDVRSRTEAAAVAHRLGLDASETGPRSAGA